MNLGPSAETREVALKNLKHAQAQARGAWCRAGAVKSRMADQFGWGSHF